MQRVALFTQLQLLPSHSSVSPFHHPQYVSTPCLKHALQAPLGDLLRDFANPRDNDRYFPFARHMDWFDGHSWASGYTVFAAGKNQVRQALCPNSYNRCIRTLLGPAG